MKTHAAAAAASASSTMKAAAGVASNGTARRCAMHHWRRPQCPLGPRRRTHRRCPLGAPREPPPVSAWPNLGVDAAPLGVPGHGCSAGTRGCRRGSAGRAACQRRSQGRPSSARCLCCGRCGASVLLRLGRHPDPVRRCDHLHGHGARRLPDGGAGGRRLLLFAAGGTRGRASPSHCPTERAVAGPRRPRLDSHLHAGKASR